MNIVLGIFKGYFYDIAKQEGNCAYPFDELDPTLWYEGDVIEIVLAAAHKCNKIIFLIDGLEPNIIGTEDSYTCRELINILYCKSIPLSKIEFMEENKIINSDYVMNKLNLRKELFI
jgi:hypothetical protein